MLRKHNKLMLFSLGLLSAISFNVKAEPVTNSHIVIAPPCLIKKLHVTYKTLSSSHQLSLIEVNDAGIDQLIEAKHAKERCGGFMDVTDAWKKSGAIKSQAKDFLVKHTEPKATFRTSTTSYSVKYQTQVDPLLKQLNPQNMWTDLTTLSGFTDRFSQSSNGVLAASWIKTQIETIAKNNGRNDVTVYYVNTKNFKQPSVVAKIGDASTSGIVIGAHMDTLSSIKEKKPGADDDGTGTVTVIEIARTLLSSGMHFKKPIYLIWYAAEEMGLIGSQNVVADFEDKNIPVSAVMQLDMTGYAYENSSTMWLIDDYANKDLTAFLEALINTYVKQPVKHTQCGYACSDHATWYKEGYASSMPFESSFGNDDPYVHTSQDTMEKLSLTHMTDYAKLGTAFAVELAEPEMR